MKRMILTLVVVVLAACNNSSAQTAPAAKKYDISVDAPKDVKAGAKGAFKIVLHPAPGFHVNQEFPTEITVDAADVKLGKAKLAKADAKVFNEKEARFEVDFQTDKPGERWFTAKARFAICTDKDCWPAKETLTWKITANP